MRCTNYHGPYIIYDCDQKVIISPYFLRPEVNRVAEHYEFLPRDQTVNKEYSLCIMSRLRQTIRFKRPELCANNSWFRHHGNAPCQTVVVLRDFFDKKTLFKSFATTSFVSLRLLAIQQIQKANAGMPFWQGWGIQAGLEGYKGKKVCRLFLGLKKWQKCFFERGFLWREWN